MKSFLQHISEQIEKQLQALSAATTATALAEHWSRMAKKIR